MARAKSAILSPAEKKEAIKNLKTSIKELKATIKADEKAHAAAVKAFEKKAAVDAKALVKLEADLAVLAPAPAA